MMMKNEDKGGTEMSRGKKENKRLDGEEKKDEIKMMRKRRRNRRSGNGERERGESRSKGKRRRGERAGKREM